MQAQSRFIKLMSENFRPTDAVWLSKMAERAGMKVNLRSGRGYIAALDQIPGNQYLREHMVHKNELGRGLVTLAIPHFKGNGKSNFDDLAWMAEEAYTYCSKDMPRIYLDYLEMASGKVDSPEKQVRLEHYIKLAKGRGKRNKWDHGSKERWHKLRKDSCIRKKVL